MEELIASLTRMEIVCPALLQEPQKQSLASVACQLYNENIHLKQEIVRLRSLLDVNIHRVPKWVH